MKKLILFLMLSFFSTAAYASSSSTLSLFGSNDTDETNILITTLYLRHYPDLIYLESFGLSHSDIRVNSRNFNYNGNREAILLDFISPDEKNKLNLDLGVTFLNDNSTITGNVELKRIFNERNALTLFLENNIVDNEESIEEDLNFKSLGVNVDHEREKFFLSGMIGSTSFSNDNRRDFIKTKLGYSVWQKHGTYAYVRTYNYENSKPSQGFYFDPESYGRYLVGVQIRKILLDGILTAHVDVGTQVFDGDDKLSYSWHADYKKKITKPLLLHIKLESNQFEPDYRYTSFFLNLTYYFDL